MKFITEESFHQILLKAAISTDWTMSSKASIFSTMSSTETFSSSRENPITSLNIPKATGSFLYSVFQKRPSYVISLIQRLAKTSKSVVSSKGLTSSRTRDIAITTFFFFLAPSFAFFAASAAALAVSSSSSSSPNRSSSLISSSFSFFLLSCFLPPLLLSWFFPPYLSFLPFLPSACAGASVQEFLAASLNWLTRQNHPKVCGWVLANIYDPLRASKASLSALDGLAPPNHC